MTFFKYILPYFSFKQYLNISLGIILITIFSACSNTKRLKKDEFLLRNNNLNLTTSQTYAAKSELKDGLKSVIVQQSNTYFLSLFPVKSWLYNLNYKKYEKDSTNFQIRSKIVEKPVIFKSSTIQQSVNQMQNLLLNQGYFNGKINTKIDTTKNKITVNYNVNAGEDFLIDTISYIVDDSSLRAKMMPIWQEKSLLKQSIPYSNALLSAERSQMVNLAKNNGYYKFNTDNIQFELDTMAQRKLRSQKSIVENAANIFAGKIKNERPTVSINAIVQEQEHYNAFEAYTYKNIYVYPEYKDNEAFTTTYNYEDTVNGLIFRYKNAKPLVKKSVANPKIFLKKNGLYRQSDYDNTLLQLNDLSIYNYARIFIFEDPANSNTGSNNLDAHIVLNPGSKYDFNTNFELSGGDLYLAGSALNASVVNKNLFRGANQLSISGTYGFELNQTRNVNQQFFERFYLMSQTIGLNTKLIFPSFLSPIKINTKNSVTPKTVFSLGFNNLDRANYFRIRTLNSSFGYVWKSNFWTTWQLNPLFFNSLNLSNISDSFRVRLEQVQAIRNAYQENFILGENVEFIHNTDGKRLNRHSFIRVALEESGTLLRGSNALVKSINGDGFNFNFANYIKLDFDLRQYYKKNNTTLVFRMHGGIGLPYGNSKTLPYIKQYFVGGAYSIRGWGPRLLGPGSYYNPALQNEQDRLFIDQSGDIKLEWNAEYRFKMIQLFAGAIGLHGALFADAGNIWLSHKDPQMPGAEFAFNKLYQDIALSTGAGLRADIGSFLILRADWAFALKKPYILEQNGWVINDINFGSKSWRSKNINLNIGIGLPF